MDFRNLSTTPNQMDSLMQRRPSLSSLSSASGYSTSSTPFTANQNTNTTTNHNHNNNNNNNNNNNLDNHNQNIAVNNAPLSGGVGVVGGGGNGSASGGSGGTKSFGIGSTTPQLTNQRLNNVKNLQTSWLNQPLSTATSVGPWVEQQQQQTLETLDKKVLEETSAGHVSISRSNENKREDQPQLSRNDDSMDQTKANNDLKHNDSNELNARHSTVNTASNRDKRETSGLGEKEQRGGRRNNVSNASNTSNANNTNNANNANKKGNNDHDNDNNDDDSNDSNDDNDGEINEELIPTAIVIKNIPFAIKKEQLLDVMTKLGLPLPYAFNYHFDNGVFRGLAFANFTSTDETSLVVNLLNGREIGGRKLRVEYKKMLPAQERERIEREKREKRGQLEEQHRNTSNASLASLYSQASTTAATKNLSVAGGQASSTQERAFINLPFGNTLFAPPSMEIDLNDPEILELYTQLVLYRDDVTKSIFELAISPINLTVIQRKTISYLCNYLNLLELFDNGLVIVRRKPGYISIAYLSLQVSASQAQQLQPHHSNSMMNLSQISSALNSDLLRSQSQSALPLPRIRQQTPTPITPNQHQQFSHLQQQVQQLQLQQPHQHQHQQTGQQQSQAPNLQGYSTFLQQSLAQQRPYSQQGYYQPPQQQQQQPQLQQPPPQQQPQQQQLQQQSNALGQFQPAHPSQGIAPNSTSAAALLRSSSNRSFVDVRATPPLNSFSQQALHQHHGLLGHAGSSITSSPIQQNQQFFLSNGTTHNTTVNNQSQPQTPLGANSRFQPFTQQLQVTSSFTNLPQTATSEDFNTSASDISTKLNTLGLSGSTNGAFDGNGIWGTK